MKFRKLTFLPLILLALVSCGGKEVSKEVANQRVAEAAQKMSEEPTTSLEATLKTNFALDMIPYVEGAPDSANSSGFSGDLDVAIKGKDLDKETPTLAVNADVGLSVKMAGTEMGSFDGGLNLYYAENFGYLDYNLAVTEKATGKTEQQSVKQKAEVGPLSALMPVESPVPADIDFNELVPLLNSVNNVKAVEKNGVLSVTYTITQEDATAMFVQFAIELGSGVLGRELTSEEVATLTANAETEVAKFITIRELGFTLEINKNGLFSKFEAGIDLDFYEYDESAVEETIAQKYTMKGSFNVGLKINEPITITLPDFTDYALVEQIGLPTN